MLKSSIFICAATILFLLGTSQPAVSGESSGELIGFNETNGIAVYFMGFTRNPDGELDRASIKFQNVTDDSIYDVLIDSYPLAQGFLVARDSEGHPISDPFFSIGGLNNARHDVNRDVVYLIERLEPGETMQHEIFFKDFVQDISLSGADEIRVTLYFVARYREIRSAESGATDPGERMSFSHVVENVPVVSSDGFDLDRPG